MIAGSLWSDIVALAGAYLIGSIPVALLLGQRRGVDLREMGSGNPGTSNLFRNAGLGIAVLSGPLQFAQGAVPLLLIRWLGGTYALQELAALAAVAGNCWPVWMRFNGQRGIAVATGAVAALSPLLLGVLLLFYALGFSVHAIALGVVTGFAALPPVALVITGGDLAGVTALLLAAIVVRRLEGIGEDRRLAGGNRRVLLRRLFFDERPGQVLVGPRQHEVPR